jgi:hypothetical protein
MSSQPEPDLRDALPKTNFFDKSVELIASFDRLMVTIYSALIAGIVLALIKEDVSFWIIAPLFLALACFVIGIAHTLLHVTFMTRLLLLAEALANGTEVVPNVIADDERTWQAYSRNQRYAQRSYASQLIYLLLGMA